MNSILSEHGKTVHHQHYENSIEKLIAKLYGLKEKLESKYYGKVECKNYDKARAFTIALNATLYEANKIQSTTDFSLKSDSVSNNYKAKIYLEKYTKVSVTSSNQIKRKIKQLDKELNDLIL